MKKKEFAVGEVFQFGLVRLRCVEDKGWVCSSCALCGIRNCKKVIGECDECYRSDNKDVVFIEVEE